MGFSFPFCCHCSFVAYYCLNLLYCMVTTAVLVPHRSHNWHVNILCVFPSVHSLCYFVSFYHFFIHHFHSKGQKAPALMYFVFNFNFPNSYEISVKLLPYLCLLFISLFSVIIFKFYFQEVINIHFQQKLMKGRR